jgi:serine/threonine protein kinase
MQESKFSGEGKLIGKYVLEKVLGEGQFGKVFRARQKDTGEFFAVKKMGVAKIDSNSTLKRLMMTEVSVMREITHPNILHLFEFLRSKDNYYLVLQYCNQGDMEHYMKQKGIRYFEEKEAVMLLKQIMNGFTELRKRKILHRDFKLANIFVNNDQLIIGDFGFAKAGVEMATTKLGSPLTMAPELLFNNDDDLNYNSKADIWSIGVVYYQMLFGEPPFFGLSVPELIRNIKKNCENNLKFPMPVSDESKDLLRRMLTIDPKKRIEWSEFFDHPVFLKFTAKQLEDIQDISQIFGALKLTAENALHKTEVEFDRNKNQRETLDKIQFLKQNEIVHLDKNITVQGVEEKTIDETTRKTIFNDMVSKEIYFRYGHELNKISFLTYTVSFIQNALHYGRFAFLAQHMFNICLLIIKKAIVLTNANLTHLMAKNNIYRLSQVFFDVFCNSKAYNDAQELFTNEIGKLIQYYSLIQRRAGANSVPIVYSNLLNQASPNLLEIDSFITSELGYMKMKDAVIVDPNDKYQLILINQCAVCSVESEMRFPYLVQEKGNTKFDWDEFYKWTKGEL